MTAIISLILGIQQITLRVGGYFQHAREATALTEAARRQAARGEFAQAWSSLDRATALADADAVREARIDVAFAWLEEGRPGPGRPFSTITDTVTPALDHALIKARGARRADIMAHLGWASFLRLRDGSAGDPAARYQEALAVDPGNPYANAMLAHWMMWRGGQVQAARERFDAALATAGPRRPFVRRFQLAALMNRAGDADAELLRVVSDMRERGETLEPRAAEYLYALYARHYGPSARVPPATKDPLTPAASTAVFEWVLPTAGTAERQPAVTAIIRSGLQEAAGDRAAALETLRDLQRRERLVSPIRERVEQAVARLTSPGARP